MSDGVFQVLGQKTGRVSSVGCVLRPLRTSSYAEGPPCELPRLWSHHIPRWCAVGVKVHRRFVESRIVQATRLDTEYVRKPLQPHKEGASAIWAKSTFYCATGTSAKLMETCFAAQLEGGFLDDHDSRMTAAARLAAIAAMTVQHHSRFGIALVANGSAGTSTRQLRRHESPPLRGEG
jgi:hypothetical protein